FDIRIGDRLIFQKTGAYSADEGMALFLSHELPAVYILSDNEIHIAREMQETLDLHIENKED
ncbi:MAG: diaminopimelate decarboxylase, partial [Lachnospiraceae bacterium]|nr:diaminopimelate decarboxylase [Lachnospiraceae bacterium]